MRLNNYRVLFLLCFCTIVILLAKLALHFIYFAFEMSIKVLVFAVMGGILKIL